MTWTFPMPFGPARRVSSTRRSKSSLPELAKRKVNRLWGLPRPHGLLEQAEGLSAEEATRLVRLACAKKNASDDIVATPSDSHSAAHGVEHA